MAIHYFTDEQPTVDEVSAAALIPINAKWTNLTQVATCARAYGLKAAHRRPLTKRIIQEEIDAGCPVIALINYSIIPDNQDAFQGAHFVLIVGYGPDTVIFHDPDRLEGDEFGEFREVAWSTFLVALGSTSQTPGNTYNDHGILLDVKE